MEDHRTIFQQHYAHAAVSDFHGALVDACVQADRTTAPQVENGHGRSCGAKAHILRCGRSLATMPRLVCSGSRAGQRHLRVERRCGHAQIGNNVTVYLSLNKSFVLPVAARGIGSTGQSPMPSRPGGRDTPEDF
jgi:hypothetical protein